MYNFQTKAFVLLCSTFRTAQCFRSEWHRK